MLPSLIGYWWMNATKRISPPFLPMDFTTVQFHFIKTSPMGLTGTSFRNSADGTIKPAIKHVRENL
jgi:hypothetical protein